jgi:hypothetical protein
MKLHRKHFLLGILMVAVLSIGSLLLSTGKLDLLASSVTDIIRFGGRITLRDIPRDVPMVPGGTGEQKVDYVALQAINIILYLCGTVAGVMIIIGGIRYIISAGDEDMMTGAKKTIIWALLGLFMTILAWAIVLNVVRIGSLEQRLDNSEDPIGASQEE